jgi:hypothetical protein
MVQCALTKGYFYIWAFFFLYIVCMWQWLSRILFLKNARTTFKMSTHVLYHHYQSVRVVTFVQTQSWCAYSSVVLALKMGKCCLDGKMWKGISGVFVGVFDLMWAPNYLLAHSFFMAYESNDWWLNLDLKKILKFINFFQISAILMTEFGFEEIFLIKKF